MKSNNYLQLILTNFKTIKKLAKIALNELNPNYKLFSILYIYVKSYNELSSYSDFKKTLNLTGQQCYLESKYAEASRKRTPPTPMKRRG
jgi:hypothetical protein